MARVDLAVEVVVFDVLGTLVDEPAGLRAAIASVVPDGADVEALLTVWQGHVAREQQQVVDRGRAYVPSEVIDAEAAALVADHAGVPGSAPALRRAAARLDPWPDSRAGLARLAGHLPVLALSNASRPALLRLAAHAGLRWHQALSAQDVSSYKPDPAVYRLAVDVAGCPPERVLMVAAHAWDLRGARAAGLRTAYVTRPVGDRPEPGDRFDLSADGLDELADQLGAGRP